MVGYDPDDPVTAHGFGKAPVTYTTFLDKNGLKGARIGILRESMGYTTEPDSEDFKKVTGDVRQGGRASSRPPAPWWSTRSRSRSSTSCWRGAAPARGRRRRRRDGLLLAPPEPVHGRWRRSASSPDYAQGDAAPSVSGRPGTGPLGSGGPRRADDQHPEGDGRPQARRHRPQDRRAHADADQGRHQPAVRQPEGRAAPQHVPDLRARR